jgi:flagellar protein FliL
MAAAALEQESPVRKGPSLIVQIAVLLAMTGVAVGGGWFAGGQMQGGGSESAAAPTHAAPAPGSGHGEAASGHDESEVPEGHPTIIPLAPITTNVAQPADVWMRLEISLVFDKAPEDPALADAVHQDLLAYIRTLKLHQIEGASGFAHLRADLEERASIRTEGLAKRLLIRTMLLE